MVYGPLIDLIYYHGIVLFSMTMQTIDFKMRLNVLFFLYYCSFSIYLAFLEEALEIVMGDSLLVNEHFFIRSS